MLTSYLYRTFVILFGFSLVFGSPDAFAKKIRTVYPDGSFELDNGLRRRLAGIEIDQDFMKLVPILLAGQEVRVEEDRSRHRKSDDDAKLTEPPGVYVYIRTQELRFGLAESGSSKTVENRVMMNKLLVKLGAATVKPTISSKYRDEFLKVQAEAQKVGAGIWSYRTSSTSSIE